MTDCSHRRHPALVAAARLRLPVDQVPATLADEETPEVLAYAHADRIDGLLSRAIEDGVVVASDEARAAVRASVRRSLVWAMAHEAVAAQLTPRFADAGVRWAVTKGPALAQLDYADSLLRPFVDLDVVIASGSWATAISVLAELEFRRVVPELRSGWDDRYGKGATFVGPERLHVDMHRRLAIGRFSVRSDATVLLDDLEEVQLGGVAVPALNRSNRFVHACFHACLGGHRRLRAFRDVAQLLLVNDADWRAARAVAQGWDAEVVIAAAIRETWQQLALDVVHPAHQWAELYPITKPEQSAIDTFRQERPFREQALTAVSVLPLVSVPRYLFPLALPGAESRAARGESLLHHLRVAGTASLQALRGRPIDLQD